jgi:hypothetical protein
LLFLSFVTLFPILFPILFLLLLPPSLFSSYQPLLTILFLNPFYFTPSLSSHSPSSLTLSTLCYLIPYFILTFTSTFSPFLISTLTYYITSQPFLFHSFSLFSFTFLSYSFNPFLSYALFYSYSPFDLLPFPIQHSLSYPFLQSFFHSSSILTLTQTISIIFLITLFSSFPSFFIHFGNFLSHLPSSSTFTSLLTHLSFFLLNNPHYLTYSFTPLPPLHFSHHSFSILFFLSLSSYLTSSPTLYLLFYLLLHFILLFIPTFAFSFSLS